MRYLLPVFFVSIALSAGCDGNGGGSQSTDGTGGDGGSGASGGTAGGGGTAGDGGAGASGGTGGAPTCGNDVAPPNEILPDATDPEQGNFTLDEALAELPDGPGPLRAIIDTDLGTVTCTMHP